MKHTEYTMKNLNSFGRFCLRLRIIRVTKESEHIGQCAEVRLNLWNPLSWLVLGYIFVTKGWEEAKEILDK